MWTFLKNKHDSSFDNLAVHCKLKGFDGTIATFTDLSDPSDEYTVRNLTSVQEQLTQDVAAYYDGKFTIIAQEKQK